MKILYFYPENPLSFSQGNNARALSLLHYFRDRSIYVDLVGERSDYFSEDSITELKAEKLITEGFLLEKVEKNANRFKYYFNYSFPRQLNNKIKDFDRTKFGYKEQFIEILNAKEYDYIIMSYVYWSPLLDNAIKEKKTKWIIDTHDFLTSQFQNKRKFVLDNYFKYEINSLKKFDSVWVISSEEKYLFSQFVKTPVNLINHSLPNNIGNSISSDKNIDILYVASANEHNINSANWFFDEVYPKLSKNIKITVVGKINSHIAEFKNVEKIPFVKELDNIYTRTKITICPMLSGTGVKIKVIESLSHGIPIVCTERGVDGLINKTNNGCLSTNDPLMFSYYIHQLLNDKEFYEKNQMDAKIFFEDNFDLQTVYKVLDTIF